MKLISSFWTVLIICFSVSLIFLAYGFFHEFKPNMAQAVYNNAFADQEKSEADKMPQAKKRKAKAIQLVKEKSTDWNAYVATRTPPSTVGAGGIDISENPYKLASDTWTFRDHIQKAVNAQLTKGGVKLVGSGPSVPLPEDVDYVGGLLSSFYNYPGIKFPVLIFRFPEEIQVQGTAAQIMQNVEAYKTMPNYLAMADGLRIEGTSPLLTGTYNLTLVAFIRGNKVYGAIPQTPGAGAGGGGFGGRGGMGGFPGMGGPGGRMGGPGGRMGGPSGPGGMGGVPPRPRSGGLG
jgi:hypothetical protein